MKPKPTVTDLQDDLFKTRLSDLINPNHALCRLAHQIDWAQLEKHIDPVLPELSLNIPLNLVFPSNKQYTTKLRAFIDHISELSEEFAPWRV